MSIDPQLLIFTDRKKLLQPQLKSAQHQCQVCNTNLSKYQCPKCKIHYCALVCYQKHSEDCVSKFQLETEMDKFKGIKASLSEQIATKKALGRFYRESKDEPIIPINEGEQIDRLEELLELSEQGQLNMDQLTIQEQDEFASYLRQITEDAWKPWWEVEEGIYSLYVEDLDDVTIENENHQQQQAMDTYREFRLSMKNKIRTIIPFNKLCRIHNPDLRNHLFNIIMSISIVSRVLNGEVIEQNDEFFQLLLGISYSMKNTKAQTIGSLQLSFNSIREHANQLDKELFQPYLRLDDVLTIFSNKFYVVETLFQAYDCLHSIEMIDECELQQKQKQYLHEIGIRKHKLIFYISYAMEQNHQFYKQLRDEIIDIVKEL